ncbi:hypothetical protein ACKAV7_012866 [Fusarium commune]
MSPSTGESTNNASIASNESCRFETIQVIDTEEPEFYRKEGLKMVIQLQATSRALLHRQASLRLTTVRTPTTQLPTRGTLSKVDMVLLHPNLRMVVVMGAPSTSVRSSPRSIWRSSPRSVWAPPPQQYGGPGYGAPQYPPYGQQGYGGPPPGQHLLDGVNTLVHDTVLEGLD